MSEPEVEEKIEEVAPENIFGSGLWGDRTPDPNADRRCGIGIPTPAATVRVPERKTLVVKVP